MGTQLPPPKRGTAAPSHFVAHVYCGQTAGWIRIPLGTVVGLGPGHTVFDGDPTTFPLKEHSPQFLAMSVVAEQLDGSRCHLVRR